MFGDTKYRQMEFSLILNPLELFQLGSLRELLRTGNPNYL